MFTHILTPPVRSLHGIWGGDRGAIWIARSGVAKIFSCRTATADSTDPTSRSPDILSDEIPFERAYGTVETARTMESMQQDGMALNQDTTGEFAVTLRRRLIHTSGCRCNSLRAMGPNRDRRYPSPPFLPPPHPTLRLQNPLWPTRPHPRSMPSHPHPGHRPLHRRSRGRDAYFLPLLRR